MMNLARMNGLFETAERGGRMFLLEYEVYQLLKMAGLPAPKYFFLRKGEAVRKADLLALGSEEVVIKVVSPFVLHKSDAGGVRFVRAEAKAVAAARDEMAAGVPGRFLAWSRRSAAAGEAAVSRREVEESITGVMVCEKVKFENVGYGSEILIGIRNSREFGPVLTIGAGGLDVEYMNERIKDGQAAAVSSAHLLGGNGLGVILEPLAFYGKIAGSFRGRKPIVSPETLADAARRFAGLAAAYSPQEDATPFVIEEMEVNPFVIRRGRLVPLDGLCRFSRNKRPEQTRPAAGVGHLLRPGSIGIIGVSERMNIGHMILNNILRNGFPKERVYVVKPGPAEIEGCRCVPSVRDLPEAVDLFVLTLGAEQSYGIMKEIVDDEKARSVILIAGGLGEKEGTQNLEGMIRALVVEARKKGRLAPVVNGGNCLGIISKPGKYDTTFIPDYKLPRPKSQKSDMAFISQSGAFMISRMSKMPSIEPLYAVSLGNQIDLTASDYLNHLKDDPAIKTFAVYMEGFQPGDGLSFARAVSKITAAGRTVIVYKAGRSPEGRGAASSHTASVAGDYGICRAVLEQAGAVVAKDIFEFENFMKGLAYLGDRKARGNRVGLVSNAGFECVIMADSLKDADSSLVLAEFTEATRNRISAALSPLGIDKLQDIHNPLDVTPVGDDAAFSGCAEAVIEDPSVDCAVISPVPMTAAMRTLAPSSEYRESILDPESFAQRMIVLFRRTAKPVVVNIDAGKLYDPLCDLLDNAGIPVFRRSDEALRFLRAFVRRRSPH
jgi:acyl-CoA synthetase (NDP forming)